MFFISVFVATLSLVVGGFAIMVGRTPGQRREFTPSSVFIAASAYAFVDGLGNLPGIAPHTRSVLGGFAMALGGLFLVGAMKYVARAGGHLNDVTYKAMRGALWLSIVVSLVPAATYTENVTERTLAHPAAIYYDTEPTVLGYVVFGVFIAALLILLVRTTLDWRRGVPQAGYYAAAFAALSLAGIADLMVVLDVSPLPYLLSEGIFFAGLCFGAALVKQVVDDRVALDGLRVELEARVAERTRELERRTDDLSRAERLATVGRLASGIAHELNNPTAAIKASLDDARIELLRQSGRAELRACIDISLAAVDRVTRIVRQLGAMAGGADSATHLPTTSLAMAVRAALVNAQDLTRADVSITTDVDSTFWVRGMPTALEEAIAAIVRNAVEAVPDGRSGAVTVSAAVADGGTILTVRDNGVGMRDDVIVRAFEPFFTTKELGRSSGLGLSVAKGLVETMGGTLHLRSIAGVGTEVSLKFLVGNAPEHSTPRPVNLHEPPSDPPPLRPRVLLVDDDELVRIAMRRYMARAFDVEAAATVREGLAKASREFDAILSDVVMPDGGGQRFYLELLARDPVLAERVIFVTGGAFRGELQDFLQTQTQPVLSKPVRLSELKAAVARLSGRTT